MAAVTNFAASSSSSSDGGKPVKRQSDAKPGFAAMIADAGETEPPGKAVAVPHDVRNDGKTRHAQRDDDTTNDNDDRDMVANGTTPALLQPTPTPTPVASASSGKSGKASAEGSERRASALAATLATGPNSGVDLTQSVVEPTDPTLAPVLAALADSLAIKQASDQPSPAGVTDTAATVQTTAAAVAIPATATAALMASRIPTKGTPFSGRADARVSASDGKTGDDDGADASGASGDASAATLAATTPFTVAAANSSAAPPAYAPLADGAASQLATGAADRQLDLAKQGAWLDGLSHDIAAAGSGSGPLRFEVSPQHLGAVQVEMTRDGNGATVTLTASSEAGRIALADARPQLIAEARSNGIHIASAQVDVGGGQTGSSDSRQSSSGESDSRPSAPSSSDTGGFSSQTNAQGQSGRQSQTRSQPVAANLVSRTGSPAADPAPTEPNDGRYA